jgi:predicted Abi (CAAX) family protease
VLPVSEAGADPELRIGRSPVQITGRWTALVQLLAPAPGTDRYRVQHFDPASGRFAGPIESVRIPRQPPDRYGRRLFDPRGLETTPVGAAGWFLHGAPDAAGVFTVQALEPRLLTQLRADRRLEGTAAALHQISQVNWNDTPRQRGSISRVALWPGHGRRTILGRRDDPEGHADWAIGDQALLIHSFGGIGGPGGEPTPFFTVTGHFAFGQARVIADPFTGEPRFQLTYHQIYANNPNGIVAGTQDWSAYMGNLQRGWLGTRPVSDVLVKGDGQLLRELALQSEVLMARYRSGDGSGIALVTPATSCVQDSAQALWIAIDLLRRGTFKGSAAAQATSSGAATGAEAAGGNEPVAERQRLAALGRSLDRLLTPFGMVRSDWRRNAERVAGSLSHAAAGTGSGFHSGQSTTDVLLSWRSMLPRRAHDEFAQVFVRHGAPLWILRTNQVPGADGRLEPLAPTLVLGMIPVLSTLLRRLTDALFAPYPPSIPLTLALLGVYAALVLPQGLRSGFLAARRRRSWPTGQAIARAAGLFVMPALVEELIFRVALLPHPLEGSSPPVAVAWGALSVGLFTLYHPLAGRLWYRSGRPLFEDPRFLLPCALLGVVCVIAYGATGSLWPPVLIHWIVVVVWLELLGGREALQG